MRRASLIIHPHELSREWIARMKENKIPTLALHPVGGKSAARSFAELLKLVETKEFRALIDEAADAGLYIEYEMHAVRTLLPESEFAEHPEWFRMNEDGERVTDYNLCSSNPEAMDYLAERVADAARRLYKSTDRYFFWTDDAKDSFCHCEACRAFSPSDQQMKILNHVLRRLRRDNPKASLAYLAYYDSLTPPEKIKPDDGIFLEYAPYERDFSRPLCESVDGENLERLVRVFGKGRAKALDYWYDNSCFSGYKKPPKELKANAAVIAADFEYYESLGFEDISSFACYLGRDYEELYGAPDISAFAGEYHKRNKTREEEKI